MEQKIRERGHRTNLKGHSNNKWHSRRRSTKCQESFFSFLTLIKTLLVSKKLCLWARLCFKKTRSLWFILHSHSLLTLIIILEHKMSQNWFIKSPHMSRIIWMDPYQKSNEGGMWGLPTTWCQFHQRFTHVFFMSKSFRQFFSSYVWLCDFWHQNFVQKTCA